MNYFVLSTFTENISTNVESRNAESFESSLLDGCAPINDYLDNVIKDASTTNASLSDDDHNDYSDDESSDEINDDDNVSSASSGKTLAEDLFLFFIMFNLTNSAMKNLLLILNRHGVNVPSSLYLLRQCCSEKVNLTSFRVNENFAWIGVTDNIVFCVQQGFLNLTDFISNTKTCFLNIKINVDGLPLYKSSSVNLWPILMIIENISSPLPLGIFCGIGKPELTSFLKKMCEELKHLKEEGFWYRDVCVRLNRICFVCDAPARAFLQCIVSHTGYNGCGYCRQEGQRVDNRLIFPVHDSPSRTDECYASVSENNQIKASPLINIVPLKSSFPPEYMHLCCLGVMKKLFNFYFSSNKGHRLRCRLSSSQTQQVSSIVASIRSYTPKEFQRKIRPPDFLPHFKASEFRSYMLYFAPVCLRDSLPPEYMHHFLLFHFSMYVFCSSRFNHYYECAEQCLKMFVHDMSKLFGSRSLVYNVHVLLHLPSFVSAYGPLDSFSSFPFESFLGLLKKRMRCNNAILQQSLNHLISLRSLTGQKIVSKTFSFSDKAPDNCAVLENDTVLLITRTDSISGSISGYILYFFKDLYSYPYPSSTLGLGFYKLTSRFVSTVIPVNKAICLPSSNDMYIVLPFA